MTAISYVGWGEKTRTVNATHRLGVGVLHRGHKARYGLRAAAWDAAYGYVSGFRKRDILWFVLTRSLSRRVWKRAARAKGYDLRRLPSGEDCLYPIPAEKEGAR